MLPLEAREALQMWPSMAPVVFVPHTEEEYLRIVALLDQLIDEVGEQESHPLASLMEILGVLVEAYETEHVPEL
jgi:HTH-type transcriptional regulator/antitoxin HigA